MDRIIIEIVSSPGTRRDFRVFEKSEVSIGRGFGNDLIIHDPYVDTAHLLVKCSGNGLLVEDLNSMNGVYLKDKSGHSKQKISSVLTVPSGQVLYFGQTTLQVYLASHPVAPAHPLHPTTNRMSAFIQPRDFWAALIGFFILGFIHANLFDEYARPQVGQTFFFMLLMVVILAVWAGSWAFNGHIFRRRGEFAAHMTMVCLASIVMIVIDNLSSYLGYWLLNPWVENGVGFFLGALVVGFLIFGHLFYSTSMRFWARLVAASVFPVLVLILSAIGVLVFQDKFSQSPPYYDRVKPPIFGPPEGRDADSFLMNLKGVFESGR